MESNGKSVTDRGGSRTRRSQAAPARHFSVCVPGLDIKECLSCRSRYRAEQAGLMKASWAPAAPAILYACSDFISDHQIRRIAELISNRKENRTATPSGTTF